MVGIERRAADRLDRAERACPGTALSISRQRSGSGNLVGRETPRAAARGPRRDCPASPRRAAVPAISPGRRRPSISASSSVIGRLDRLRLEQLVVGGRRRRGLELRRAAAASSCPSPWAAACAVRTASAASRRPAPQAGGDGQRAASDAAAGGSPASFALADVLVAGVEERRERAVDVAQPHRRCRRRRRGRRGSRRGALPIVADPQRRHCRAPRKRSCRPDRCRRPRRRSRRPACCRDRSAPIRGRSGCRSASRFWPGAASGSVRAARRRVGRRRRRRSRDAGRDCR